MFTGQLSKFFFFFFFGILMLPLLILSFSVDIAQGDNIFISNIFEEINIEKSTKDIFSDIPPVFLKNPYNSGSIFTGNYQNISTIASYNSSNIEAKTKKKESNKDKKDLIRNSLPTLAETYDHAELAFIENCQNKGIAESLAALSTVRKVNALWDNPSERYSISFWWDFTITGAAIAKNIIGFNSFAIETILASHLVVDCTLNIYENAKKHFVEGDSLFEVVSSSFLHCSVLILIHSVLDKIASGSLYKF